MASIVVALTNGDGESGPLSITTPRVGQTLNGNTVAVTVAASTGGGRSAEVMVDGEPPPAGQRAPRSSMPVNRRGIAMFYGLSPGEHRIRAFYVDGSRTRVKPEELAETTFTMAGPSVAATLEGSFKQGEALRLKLAVTNIESPFGAPGNPNAGRIQILIDTELPPRDAPIPQGPSVLLPTTPDVLLPQLPAGVHRMWVVYADARHIPLRPLVADRIRFTIS